MDLHSTPFPGKTKPSKPKTNRIPNSKEPPIPRQKRVFGTTRSTNIPVKTLTEKKPTIKSPIGVSQKQPKSPRPTPSVTEAAVKQFPDKTRPKLKKKSVCFQEQVVENVAKNSREGDIVGPRTPVKSPCITKPKIPGTPYHSAENCSNCRFNRLETSSYWLGQIKLAESVGKHFVSAAFFRLAIESKAEPIRNLRVELKRYLARHAYLSTETEWRDVSISYGLVVKDESDAGEVDCGIGKAGTSEITGSDLDQEQELKEQPVQQFETKGLESNEGLD